MTNWGDASDAFNANYVKLQLQNKANTPVFEEIVLMEQIRVSKNTPIDRTVTRSGPLNTSSFVIRDIHVTANISKKLYSFIETQSEPTASGGFNTVKFRISTTSIGAVATDAIAVTFEGFIYDLQEIANADQKFTVDFIVRETGTFTVT